MRAAIEVGDFAGAADELNDLETIGLPRELQPAISVLVGRLSEGMGRNEEALAAYRTAADSWDRPAAAQGRLREASLRYALGDLKREEVISELETLTTIWRGDETEVEALEILARLYTEEGRYRDAFYVMRNAVAANPDSDMTRRIQDEAAATFDSLFLAGKGDALSAIDALALFYDFRELTPIGRRGDEMIRRLADRSGVRGPARSGGRSVAVPGRSPAAGRRARASSGPPCRHLSDEPQGRPRAGDTAQQPHRRSCQRIAQSAPAAGSARAVRSRPATIWRSKWSPISRARKRSACGPTFCGRRGAGRSPLSRSSLYYGERWKEWQPLNEVERADILRAAIGYALGEDALGLGRFREKYAAKMAQTPDAHDFEVVSAPLGTSGTEFRDIARAAAAIDTLDGFLRDMQVRFRMRVRLRRPLHRRRRRHRRQRGGALRFPQLRRQPLRRR